MNEDQVRQIVQEMLDKQKDEDQFTVSKIPVHTHNGTDSVLLGNLKGINSITFSNNNGSIRTQGPSGYIVLQGPNTGNKYPTVTCNNSTTDIIGGDGTNFMDIQVQPEYIIFKDSSSVQIMSLYSTAFSGNPSVIFGTPVAVGTHNGNPGVASSWKGYMYYDTSTNKMNYSNGTSWVSW
jgi:hypothetical protein